MTICNAPTDKPVKAGTRIRFRNHGQETGTVVRWNAKVSGKRSDMPGWEIVKFDDNGGKLACHRESFYEIA